MKTVVFYYSQTGQALDAVKSICGASHLNEKAQGTKDDVVYKEIRPLEQYPFPWSRYEFFDTFPETRLGMPPSGIEAIDFSDINDADIVIVAGQSWFLSPSLPLQSFFMDEQVRHYLQGRQIVFVNACRNMWLMTSRDIKAGRKQKAFCPMQAFLTQSCRLHHASAISSAAHGRTENRSCCNNGCWKLEPSTTSRQYFS